MQSDNEHGGLVGLNHSGRVAAFVVPVLVAVVFFGGVAGRNYPEIYPFASWGMFANVPSRLTTCTLLIHAVDGQAVVPPKPVFLVPQLGKVWRTPKALSYVEQHCAAVHRASQGVPGAYGTFLDTRAAVETFFDGHTVQYEPLRVACNPLYFLRDGTFDTAARYGTFTTGEAVSMAQIRQHAPQQVGMPTP